MQVCIDMNFALTFVTLEQIPPKLMLKVPAGEQHLHRIRPAMVHLQSIEDHYFCF
jgi:hypothetical protein